MMITEEEYMKLCKFLDAGMSIEEMNNFEQELNNNPKLREQLNFEQGVREALFNNNDIIELPQTKYSFLATPIFKVAIAASFIGIITTTYFLFKPKNSVTITKQNKPSNIINSKNDTAINAKELFTSYYKKDNLPNEIPLVLASALSDYKQNQYEKILAFNEDNIPETRGVNDAINSKENIKTLVKYYKAIAYIEEVQYNKAIPFLNQILEQHHSIKLRQSAEWYLALSYLNIEVKQTKSYLQAIIKNPSHLYYTKAKTLLQELK
jgi:hypothetical protein